jgi:glyoxylase-like metal-dependent hydrolase (beta-lactamase superfamily II)
MNDRQPMTADFQRAGLLVFERGWLSSNNILFAGDAQHESVLVDSGYHSEAGQTLALVQEALGGRRLERIVNTHLHSDHCGGNHVLQQAWDCRIDVPAGEADKVDRWDEAALTYRSTGQHCPRFKRSGALRDGDEFMLGAWRWQAHASPGHDPESLMLFQPEFGLLISADALWQNGFGVVFPELDGASAFADVAATLDRIESLPVRWVIPGHGAPFGDVSEALGRARRRLDSLVADPVRHAQHAARVLIKFHLMELQRQPLTALREWIDGTSYFRLIHERFGGARPYREWCEGLLADLLASGALRVEGEIVENC